MIAEQIYSLDVPETHLEVIETLASRDTHTAAIWAMTGQATDTALITALTKTPVRQLPLREQGALHLSDQVIDAVLSAKRASIITWAATQHVSEQAAIRLAKAGPKAATNILTTGYSTVACRTAVQTEHAAHAAEWMLNTGDYTHLDAVDFPTFTSKHGKWLMAFIAGENPDDYDQITAGLPGAWIRAGNHRLTLDTAAGLCTEHPDTIMSIAWNPYLSPTAIRQAKLVDLATEHGADIDAVDKAIDALRFRHDRYGDKTATHPATEEDPDTLTRLIRRACRDDYHHPRHADFIELVRNPHLTADQRERMARFAANTAMAPARIQLGWHEALRDALPVESDYLLAHTHPEPGKEYDDWRGNGITDDTLLHRFTYWSDGVADYLFTNLPAQQSVWEAVDLLWDSSQMMTVKQFCQLAAAV